MTPAANKIFALMRGLDDKSSDEILSLLSKSINSTI